MNRPDPVHEPVENHTLRAQVARRILEMVIGGMEISRNG